MNLDNLIPHRIIDLCDFTRLDVDITVKATCAGDKWPRMQIWIDDQLIQDTVVVQQTRCQLTHRLSDQQTSTSVKVIYLNKTNADTVVDANGQILENMTLEITGLIINDVDLLANNLVYTFGHYVMNLSDDQRAYFEEHGINAAPSHSLFMSENGQWCWQLPVPVMSAFVSRMSPYEKHERWLDSDLYQKIYTKIQDVLQLQELVKNQVKTPAGAMRQHQTIPIHTNKDQKK